MKFSNLQRVALASLGLIAGSPSLYASCCNSGCLFPVSSTQGAFLLEGGVLLYKAYGDGLGYAQTLTQDVNENGTIQSNRFDCHNLDHNWDWGFRVAAGYTGCSNGFDVVGRWSHYYTIAKAEVFSDQPALSNTVFTAWNTNIFNMNLFAPNTDITLTVDEEFGRGEWSWNLDDFSVELGKAYPIGNCLTLRPFIAFRAISSRQSYESRLEQTMTLTENDDSFSFEAFPESVARNNMEAYGFGAGLQSRWYIFECLDIFGKFTFSTVRGTVRSSFQEGQGGEFVVVAMGVDPGIALEDLLIDTKTKCHFYDWKTICDLSVGIRYSQKVCQNQGRVSIYAAWEQTQFYNFNHLRPVSSPALNLPNFTSPQGDLSLWGFVFGAAVDF